MLPILYFLKDRFKAKSGLRSKMAAPTRELTLLDDVLSGKWPNGRIYYRIAEQWSLITQAIEEWNRVNSPHCQFVLASQDAKYFVTFQIVQNQDPNSSVGCYHTKNQFIRIPKAYANGTPIGIGCILHEMMHCAGFLHEHTRPDRDQHVMINTQELQKDPRSYKISMFGWGHYDLFSLMHYEHDPNRVIIKDNKAKEYVGKGETFSAGDRAAIKIAYAPKDHHGDHHDRPAHGSKCEVITDGVKCPYFGTKEHWSCCMRLDGEMCEKYHSGFWHPSECSGSGCLYRSDKPHWSCCNKEDKDNPECLEGISKPNWDE